MRENPERRTVPAETTAAEAETVDIDQEALFESMMEKIAKDRYGNTEPLRQADLWNRRQDVQNLFRNLEGQPKEKVMETLAKNLDRWVPNYRKQAEGGQELKIVPETIREAAAHTAELAAKLQSGEAITREDKAESFRKVAETLFRSAPETATIDWITDSRIDIVNIYANLVEANETKRALETVMNNVRRLAPEVRSQKARETIRKSAPVPAAAPMPQRHGSHAPESLWGRIKKALS